MITIRAAGTHQDPRVRAGFGHFATKDRSCGKYRLPPWRSGWYSPWICEWYSRWICGRSVLLEMRGHGEFARANAFHVLYDLSRSPAVMVS